MLQKSFRSGDFNRAEYQNDIFTSQLKYSRLQHISGNLMSHDSFCDCYFDRYCGEADSVEQIAYAGAVGI